MRHILAHMFILTTVLAMESRTTTDESRATLGSFSGLSALSWAVPRLYQYPKFLSDDEIDHLVNYARASKIFEAAEARLEAVRQTGQDESSLPLLTSVYFDWNAIYNDPIVNAIEQRIAIVTGMPPHKHEEPLNVHRIRTLRRDLAWPQNKTSCRGKTCPRKVTSIHHDKVQKEHSTATVLVYLNDVSEGGGTIFPCGSIPPRAPHDGVVSGACSEAFKEGARWYDGSDTTVKGRPKKLTTPTPVDDELAEILWAAHLGCHATSAKNDMANSSEARGPADPFVDWKKKPVRTLPVKGTALVFFHTHPNGAPDPYAWHAGCVPLSNEKWTLQKFKEMPMQWR